MASAADQLPGCTIPDRCVLHPDQGLGRRTAFCENNLGCICKVDNHLGTNSLFSSECLLKECTDGHGRKSFLNDWLEACQQVGKSGWDDMPWEWEPYLPNEGRVVTRPTTFMNAPPVITSIRAPASVSVVASTAAIVTSLPVTSLSMSLLSMTTFSTSITTTTEIYSTSTNSASSTSSSGSEETSPPQPIVVTSRNLSPGAIGGIVAGIFVLITLCAGLGYFYWKSNRKAKRKTREVAILSDRVSGCGFQKYIDDLLADSNSSTGTIIRHPAPTPDVLETAAGSTSTVEGVRSQSSSVHSMDIARAM